MLAYYIEQFFLLERRHCECCVDKNRPSPLKEYCTTHKYDICIEVEDLLEAFAELRKATVKTRHVCPSSWKTSAPTCRIFIKSLCLGTD